MVLKIKLTLSTTRVNERCVDSVRLVLGLVPFYRKVSWQPWWIIITYVWVNTTCDVAYVCPLTLSPDAIGPSIWIAIRRNAFRDNFFWISRGN